MKQQTQQTKFKPSNISVIVFQVLTVSVSIFILVAFFYWTVVPYMQSSEYLSDIRQAFSTGDVSVLTDDQFVFEPDTNVQGILRGDFLREIIGEYNNGHITKANPVLDKAVSEMQDYVDNHPDYYTYILSLADGYALKSKVENNPADFETAVKYFNKDMGVIKGRQDVTYSYAISLFQNGNAQEAIALMNNLVSNNAGIYQVNYEFGTLYAMMGTSMYDKAMGQFEISLNGNVDLNTDYTKHIYQEFVSYFYKTKDMANFITALNRLVIIDPDQKYTYLGVLNYINQNHKIPDLSIDGK